ncbi:MMPL family transporter [Fructilactobacillus lindneri]|uniref:MMPL family protein n=1 Tax=Fructilactobacillus lindneri TaxID=53444 RepID=A0AB33BCA1_9LACO|nr:MMPL family transporter [Fructilactobacillus lindneri]ANZ57782.1 MMPL family protein [Fructilactobacillus lindneri]ANZ59051.1 MMPL family protein [Fructilactobacillus lindneri]POG98104.1 MMPL family protein [Fructilactobacillus lindneri]POH01781.1 MMPL family protein [Fructilactobacillus lindneri]POH03625.1 MMPL family protein [Fructilactobacillus lindneri]
MNKFVKKYTVVAILWIVAVIAAILFLPNINNLEAQKGQTKIPSDMQSQVAENMQKHWGHHISNTRQVVLVYHNDKKINASDQAKINHQLHQLTKKSDYYGIKGVTSVQNTPVAKKQLISKDKTTELVQLNISKQDSVETINNKLQKGARINGLQSYVTGSDILNNDMRVSMVDGIKKTEIIATVFILIVLIIVFRSPIVPLISILTVGVSFITSLSLVMNLVKYFNFPLSNFTQVFMVVVLFGIGTDYNILLYDQFKDDLADGMDKVAATMHARKLAGKTILDSGISVLIGFAALGLANFSIYRSGVAVAIGVILLLLVLLTLNPFFMLTLGGKMFWPVKRLETQKQRSRLWGFLSSKAVQFSVPAILLVLVVVLPLVVMGHGKLNYDDAVELNNKIPSKQGLNIVQKHFSKGTAEPATIYIKANHSLNNEKSLMTIDRITRQLAKRNDVKTVASVTEPSGQPIKQLYLNDQLKTLTGKMSQANSGLSKIQAGAANQSFNGSQLKAIGESAQSIGQHLQNIQSTAGGSNMTAGQQVVALIQQKATAMGSPLNQAQLQVVTGALQQAGAQAQAKQSGMSNDLNGIASDTQNIGNNTQSMANQLQALQGQLAAANEGLGKISQGSAAANDYLSALQSSAVSNDTFYIPNQVLQSKEFKQALNNYLSENQKITKLTVVLKDNPSSSQAMKSINNIQSQVKQNIGGTSLNGSTVAISGQTATMSDTHEIATKDFLRTAIIMLIGILLALMFVTKSILQPLYIEGTLLLAYLSSLTITKLISTVILGQKMLTWNTPFFAFIMIIALGVDYSIFLMRKYQTIDPEAEPAERIVEASKFIGVVVLSAALILGGTFAALIPSGVLTLIQVAIAVVVGLLILIIILPILLSAAINLTYGDQRNSERKRRIK